MNVHLPLMRILIVPHPIISNMISLDLGFPICQQKSQRCPFQPGSACQGVGQMGLRWPAGARGSQAERGGDHRLQGSFCPRQQCLEGCCPHQRP